MVKPYQDVKVLDLQYLHDQHSAETVCDADKQQAEIDSESHEHLTTW
ncbi:hypothetical protein [Buttiauxella sp. B2]|nr:hypothetical protein [Buttiauxella sp. B2]